MKKLLCILLALTLICALFVGCGKKDEAPAEDPKDNVENNDPADEPENNDAPADEPEAKDPFKVLAVHMNLSDDNWLFINGVLEEKFTAAGCEYDATSGENDPVKQLEQIENGVVQGYDLILVIPLTGEVLADACQRALDEGVYVYSFINDCVNRSVYRTVDAAYSGEILVQYAVEEWALKHFPDAADGSINTVIMGQDTDSHTKARWDAMNEKIKEYPQINVIENIAVEESMTDGQAKTENILTMNPDKQIHLWICASSGAADGVEAAIMAENSGVDYIEDCCLVSNGLSEKVAAMMRASVNNESVYRVCAASGGNFYKNADEIVAGCMALLNGEEVDSFSPVNVDLVTPDNLEEFGY